MLAFVQPVTKQTGFEVLTNVELGKLSVRSSTMRFDSLMLSSHFTRASLKVLGGITAWPPHIFRPFSDVRHGACPVLSSNPRQSINLALLPSPSSLQSNLLDFDSSHMCVINKTSHFTHYQNQMHKTASQSDGHCNHSGAGSSIANRASAFSVAIFNIPYHGTNPHFPFKIEISARYWVDP